MTCVWRILKDLSTLENEKAIPQFVRLLFFKSSRLEVFCKKGVIRNFAKFTGKHLCQSLFFNKVASLDLQLYKKEALAQVFSCEFSEICKKTFYFLTEHLWWLLLLTHFMPLVSFYTHWNKKRRRFSNVFRGYRKRLVNQRSAWGLKLY